MLCCSWSWQRGLLGEQERESVITSVRCVISHFFPYLSTTAKDQVINDSGIIWQPMHGAIETQAAYDVSSFCPIFFLHLSMEIFLKEAEQSGHPN